MTHLEMYTVHQEKNDRTACKDKLIHDIFTDISEKNSGEEFEM